ncbi:MAG: hypothetical protein JW876_09615 [Candidatus Krumholzibacteriota bacterium]|nr:hypothetical protein [Candidatus Krumholzibacteriota bacterium]
MIEKHLDEIRRKEEAAAAALREAETTAAGIVEAARAAGRKLIEEVRIEAADEERSLLEEARRIAGERIAGLREKNTKAIAALDTSAAGRRNEALETIAAAFRSGS